MAKSYIPQLVRTLNKLCIYITRHQSTMNPYLSTAQQNALAAVVAACAAFGAVQTHEAP